jgi:hypothetical protein
VKLASKTFDEILLEAVDEALSSLGESARESIYFHLKDKFIAPLVLSSEGPCRL